MLFQSLGISGKNRWADFSNMYLNVFTAQSSGSSPGPALGTSRLQTEATGAKHMFSSLQMMREGDRPTLGGLRPNEGPKRQTGGRSSGESQAGSGPPASPVHVLHPVPTGRRNHANWLCQSHQSQATKCNLPLMKCDIIRDHLHPSPLPI